MFTSAISINNKKYSASGIMQRLLEKHNDYEESGLNFIMQLLDPSPVPVQFHTSGTTGIPRGIKFTKHQILFSAENTCRYFNINQNSSLLLCLPTDFVAGRMMIARAMAVNANLIWRKPSLNPLADDVKIDFAAFTPAQVAEIISFPDSNERFKRIPTIIIGGGIISEMLEQKLKDYSNQIFVTYGMTETLSHIAVRKIGEEVFESVYDGLKLDMDDNHCLKIKLPFIEDEYLQTRDRVELIHSKGFRFLGRLDNMIHSGGVKISSEEIENKIITAGLMVQGEFYITAGKDSKYGEVPVLVVAKGFTVSPTTLTAINGLLNKHHSVKRIVIIDKFEYTGTGKLIRKKIDD